MAEALGGGAPGAAPVVILSPITTSPAAIGAYKSALRRDPCSYCGAPADVLDHVTAQRDGGPDRWWNLTAACTSCNGFKNARSLIGFLLRRRYDDLAEAILVAQQTMRRVAGVGR